ncbi:MAG: universal stress protein [Candidatus Wallbacteria bacterium]|nr:universal stress protein [Candidatus Wallbacteria bacterium]
MTAGRSRPEDFLELVERSRRGRLKVYLGFAAGVGKTYRMLEEAHTLKKRGVDVCVGIVETHGRAETASLIDGLEVIPRRRIEYRAVGIEEMDVERVLLRAPQVVIVDEIAHTNAPGSINRKRYEDVLALIEAGINVLCAFNVQHLESLNDVVERATAVTVRETVPDTFLKQADQVVTLDLAVEDLLERLRAGKIYGPEKIEWALRHFFKESNLQTLREPVLREVAESVERAGSRSAADGVSVTPAAQHRVLVSVASWSPHATGLLRRGSRLAGRLNTDWYVVYVETPEESPERIDATAQRHLHTTIEMARELGAEIVKLKGHDPVDAILDFARSHRVGVILVGRSNRSRWMRLLHGDVVQRLIDEGPEFDVLVAAHGEGGAVG